MPGVSPVPDHAATRGLGRQLGAWTECHGVFIGLGHYDPTMYRAALIRVVLMTVAVVAVGVAAYWIASVALEWL